MTPLEGLFVVCLLGSLGGGVTILLRFPAVQFSGYLLLGMAGGFLVLLLLHRWSLNSRRGRSVWTGCCVILAAAGLLFLNVEGLFLYRGMHDQSDLPADVAIVLGAGVDGETPSKVLQSRIDRAASYLQEHPEMQAVLSGGIGPGETISEAEAMRRGLVAQGIDEERLWLEEQSTSTAENFRFSKNVLKSHGVNVKTVTVAVITNDFHLFRSHLLAEEVGLSVVDVPAPTPPAIAVHQYIREFFALGKSLLLDIEHGGRRNG